MRLPCKGGDTANPPEALKQIQREVSANEPIAIAAERAANDYRWGPMLDDLRIEELLEIDADVIRRMVRTRNVSSVSDKPARMAATRRGRRRWLRW